MNLPRDLPCRQHQLFDHYEKVNILTGSVNRFGYGGSKIGASTDISCCMGFQVCTSHAGVTNYHCRLVDIHSVLIGGYIMIWFPLLSMYTFVTAMHYNTCPGDHISRKGANRLYSRLFIAGKQGMVKHG